MFKLGAFKRSILMNNEIPVDIQQSLTEYDNKIAFYLGRRNRRMKEVAQQFGLSFNLLSAWFDKRAAYLKARENTSLVQPNQSQSSTVSSSAHPLTPTKT